MYVYYVTKATQMNGCVFTVFTCWCLYFRGASHPGVPIHLIYLAWYGLYSLLSISIGNFGLKLWKTYKYKMKKGNYAAAICLLQDVLARLFS